MGNYYHILGISQGATPDEVKRAYRKLSLKFHPDRNGGDEYFTQMFRQVNSAYDTLTDPEKRRIYDSNLRDQQNARLNAERVKKLEEELAKEQLLRQKKPEFKKSYYPNNYVPNQKSQRNSSSGSLLKIKHVKFFLWIIILCLLLALVAKNTNKQNSERKEKPEYVVKKKQKRKKKKRQAFQAKIIDTISVTKIEELPADTTSILNVVNAQDSL